MLPTPHKRVSHTSDNDIQAGNNNLGRDIVDRAYTVDTLDFAPVDTDIVDIDTADIDTANTGLADIAPADIAPDYNYIGRRDNTVGMTHRIALVVDIYNPVAGNEIRNHLADIWVVSSSRHLPTC